MNNKSFSYTLLENGLDFICESLRGLRQLNIGTNISEYAKKRILKYSLLHLSSGIELIFKNILLDEHWTYVFQDMNRANQKDFESGNFKSVDSETIITRLENLCDVNIGDNDKKNLKHLREYRNRTEHFAVEYNVYAIESIVHKCISILVKVIADKYDENSISKVEVNFLKEIRILLKDLTSHYNDVKVLADKELKMLKEKYDDELRLMMCPLCGEHYLIKVDEENAKCLFCSGELTGYQIANAYINDVLKISEYEVARDGGEWPLFECPICGYNAMVLDYECNEYICFNCGVHKTVANLNRCCECGRLIDEKSEIDLCTDCWDYRTKRND